MNSLFVGVFVAISFMTISNLQTLNIELKEAQEAIKFLQGQVENDHAALEELQSKKSE